MIADKIIRICKGLNNEEKIKIISLIVREGELSITDIKKRLRMSFSTTHKYLRELEEAGLLLSKKVVHKNREKKLYRVKDFSVCLTPDTIANLEKSEEIKTKQIYIIDWEGEMRSFDSALIRKICAESGVPSRITSYIMQKISEKIYSGMPVVELRTLLDEVLTAETGNIEKVKKTIDKNDLLQSREGFTATLRKEGLEDVVKAYMDGDFQIRNLGKSWPISLQHDFYLILRHGLHIIGMEANPARSMLSVISHLETAIKAASKNLAGLQQGIDSLNILLAPFADPLPYAEIRQHVQRIFYSLDQLNKIYGIQPSISLELSVPKYLAKKPALIRGKEVGVYQDFQDASNKLLMAFVENAAESNLPYPKLFFKIRKKTEFPEGFEKILNRVYIQNLIPRWQRPNTTYLIDWSRLGPEWKGAKRTTGIPMLQMTTLNLPRLVFEAKSEEQFFSGLEALVEMVKKVNLVSVQQIVGKSCTELDFLNKRIRDDKYCHFDDGVVLLGVLGMHNAVAHLTGSYEMSLVKKILQFLDRKFKYDGIRSGIFEVDFSPIARRFAQLDELRFGRKEKYWGGLNTNLPDDEKIRLMGKLQPLLLGGHLCQLKKMTYEKIDLILKYGIGLAAAERGVYKV